MPELSDDVLRRLFRIEDALRELVAVKALKNREGKTKEYLQRRLAAWAEAKAALQRRDA